MIKIVTSHYTNIKLHNNRLYGFKGWLKNDDITDEIADVKLLSQTATGTNSINTMGATMTGAVLAGTIGAIVGAMSRRKSVEIHCVIVLYNDTWTELVTNDIELIRFLIPYMQVKRRR